MSSQNNQIFDEHNYFINPDPAKPFDEEQNSVRIMSWETISSFFIANNLPSGEALEKGWEQESKEFSEDDPDFIRFKEIRIKGLIDYLLSNRVQVELRPKAPPPSMEIVDDLGYMWNLARRNIDLIKARIDEEKAKEQLLRETIEKIHRDHQNRVAQDRLATEDETEEPMEF